MGQLLRPDRVTTVRISAELGDDMDAVARIDDDTASDVIRSALTLYIATRQADREFRLRLEQRINLDQAILRRLLDASDTARPTGTAPDSGGAA